MKEWYLDTHLCETELEIPNLEQLMGCGIEKICDLFLAFHTTKSDLAQIQTPTLDTAMIKTAATKVWEVATRRKIAVLYVTEIDRIFLGGGMTALERAGYHINQQASNPLDSNGLSRRAYNCLRIDGIDNNGHLLGMTAKKLYLMRNVGLQSAVEVMLFWRQLQETLFDESQASEASDDGPANVCVATVLLNRETGEPIRDLPLCDAIPERDVKILQTEGIQWLSEFLRLDNQTSLFHYELLSRKTKQVYVEYNKLYSYQKIVRSALADKLVPEMLSALGVTEVQWDSAVYSAEKDFPENGSAEEIIDRIYRTPAVRDKVKQVVLKELWISPLGMAKEEFLGTIPENLLRTQVFDRIIQEMSDDCLVQVVDSVIRMYVVTPGEYIRSMPDGIHKSVMLSILQNKTYRQIAAEQNRSIARIDQIFRRDLRDIMAPGARWCYVAQQYSYLLSNYNCTEEEFLQIFGVTQEEYVIMRRMWKQKRNAPHISDAANDAALPETQRKRIALRAKAPDTEKMCKGQRLENYRTVKTFLKTLLKEHCQEIVPISAFLEIYIAEADINGIPLLDSVKNITSFKVYLRNTGYVLTTQKKGIRYYDRTQYEFTELVAGLDLAHYEGQIISTADLYRANRALMKKYDIRNGDELHDLLKSIWNRYGNIQIDFKRMPTMAIGTAQKGRMQ